MTHINLFRTAPSTLSSVAWGKKNFDATASTLIFAALLIVCSFAVGCSNDQPKPVSSTNQSPIVQTTPTPAPPVATPVQQPVSTPVHKKVVRKVPPTVTYVNDVSGVSFDYPRKYALKTGDAATELVSSSPTPMDFIQPGGVALAAVALPSSTYPNSDLASAFFNVSVNKALTADQCREFSLPLPNPVPAADPNIQATAQPATPPSELPSSESPVSTVPPSKFPSSKLMIGGLELDSAETSATGELKPESREEAAKYYHVFQNGACYEFALKVATTKLDAVSTTKPSPSRIDRDEVFHRLEKILATVKINPITPQEVDAEVKTPAETPAQ
jgi:hypothetical protein